MPLPPGWLVFSDRGSPLIRIKLGLERGHLGPTEQLLRGTRKWSQQAHDHTPEAINLSEGTVTGQVASARENIKARPIGRDGRCANNWENAGCR